MAHATQCILESDEGASVAGILLGVAAELDRVRALGLAIERVTCELLQQLSADSTVMDELQRLDLMLQQVGALSDYLRSLGSIEGRISSRDLAEALARITLSELRERLVALGHCTDDRIGGALELL